MNRFMTLLTALALFAVQPNVPNVGTVTDTPAVTAPASDVAPGPDSDEIPARPLGQMPEIEVEQYGGELLHATTLKSFEPVVVGKIEIIPLLAPNEHITFPLLRPPAA